MFCYSQVIEAEVDILLLEVSTHLYFLHDVLDVVDEFRCNFVTEFRCNFVTTQLKQKQQKQQHSRCTKSMSPPYHVHLYDRLDVLDVVDELRLCHPAT